MVTVEVSITGGGLGLFLVGLPDNAVKESEQRIRSAFENSGYRMTVRKCVVNLAPADLRKEGSGFDLPIAVALEMVIQENYRDVPDAFKRRVPAGLDDWCLVGGEYSLSDRADQLLPFFLKKIEKN